MDINTSITNVANFFDKHSTSVLVIITAIYAYFTYKMASVMRRQVVADIELSNILLGSDFEESHLKEILENNPYDINENNTFRFKLLFDVRNKSSGSGSIEKPKLILKFIKSNFEYEINPKTKETWNKKIGENNGVIRFREIVEDLGATIYLRGGDSKKVEVEYSVFNSVDELIENIRNELGSLEYYIKYKDNLGKKHEVKVENIKPESDFERS